MEPQPPPDRDEDRIEALVTACITAYERDGAAAVERLIEQNPAIAAAVRERFAWLVRSGILTEAGESVTRTGLSQLLAKLPAKTGLGVHLGAPGGEGPPVRVTDEVRKLRDPSGRYQFLGEIGRGGIGIVYKGRDTDLGRDVAMKVLKHGHALDPGVLERFVEEAQIGGQLQHPGIVPVYEIGVHRGDRPYFAMKLIQGETLAAQLARRDAPTSDLPRLLSVFEQVCQTMAYAHARLVVHRDLKPANVMIGSFGEVQIVDWGLAKVLARGGVADERAQRATKRSVIETIRTREGSGSESIAGSVIGTPAYMSPEQALGQIDRIDERGDVFGLGSILCEILTGEPPYIDEDGDVLQLAASGTIGPALERLQACGADHRLIDLSVECLSPSPNHRPASAQHVAERVTAYLTSVEERAQQAELRAVAARFRQRTTSVVAAAVLAILVGGGLTWNWLRDLAEARRLEVAERLAAAIDEANTTYARAETEIENLDRWSRAESEAARAVQIAADEDVADADRGRAASLLAAIRRERGVAEREVEQRRRDGAMLDRLVGIRIPHDDNVTSSVWQQREARRLDAAYRAAFGEYLGDESVLDESIEAVAEALTSGEIDDQLAVALDDWALARDRAGLDDERTGVLRVLALKLDAGDPWRTRLRALLPDAANERARLEKLGESADYRQLSGGVIALLAEALWSAGARDRAIEVLESGRQWHPQDFLLCFRLALFYELSDEPQWAGVAAMLEVARTLRPRMNEVLHRLGIALLNLGRSARAIRVFDELLERDSENLHWYFHLAGIHERLGDHRSLTDTCRRALRVDPRSFQFRLGLADALYALGEHEEAIENAKAAVEIDSSHHTPWSRLGLIHRELGQLAAAEAAFRRALEKRPDHGPSIYNLAQLLERTGRFDEALQLYERARAVFGRRQDAFGVRWSQQSANSTARMRRFIARRPELEAILSGQDRARSATDWDLAVRYGLQQHRFLEIVRATEALGDAPATAGWSRYNSACAAALYTAGADLEDAECVRIRGLARTWLRQLVDRASGEAASDRVRQQLRLASTDADLASVRGDALARLPESERQAWRELWTSIERQARRDGR